jgi:hypothetical protein
MMWVMRPERMAAWRDLGMKWMGSMVAMTGKRRLSNWVDEKLLLLLL